MKVRIQWVDVFRGVAMLLIVIGHLPLMFPFYSPVITNSLAAMTVPAFFFISGYFFKDKDNDFVRFFSNKLKSLFIPYVLFYIVIFIFWYVLYTVTGRIPETMIEQFGYMLMGVSSDLTSMLTATPMWFITALIMTEVYFYFIRKFVKNDKYILPVLAVFGTIGYISSLYLGVRLPWNAEIAMTAVVFYGLGYMFKKYNLEVYFHSDKGYINGLFILGLTAVSMYFSLGSYTLMALSNLGNGWMMYIGAFTGIAALLFAVKTEILERNGLLQAIGRHSYTILAFHLTAMITFRTIFKLLGIALPTDPVMMIILGTLYFLIIMLTMVPTIKIVEYIKFKLSSWFKSKDVII